MLNKTVAPSLLFWMRRCALYIHGFGSYWRESIFCQECVKCWISNRWVSSVLKFFYNYRSYNCINGVIVDKNSQVLCNSLAGVKQRVDSVDSIFTQFSRYIFVSCLWSKVKFVDFIIFFHFDDLCSPPLLANFSLPVPMHVCKIIRVCLKLKNFMQ